MAKPKGNGTNSDAAAEESAMGFKDKQKALDTLKVLDGRDISYQYHVITSFVSRAKRTLQITKDEEKLANIREAQQVFQDWLNDYKDNNRSRENFSYLPIETVKGFRPLAKKYGILDDDFYQAYKSEKGDYKGLRATKTRDSSTTWDVERNRRLKEIMAKIKSQHLQWFETDVGDLRGFPTEEHARCIQLGYSPEPTKLKKLIPQVEKKFEFSSSEDEEMDLSDAKDEAETRATKKTGAGSKRKHDSYSEDSVEDSDDDDDDDDDEEPKKKTLKKDDKESSGEKNDDDNKKGDKEESGLSFKDKQRAVNSIKCLEGRDVSYQYHAITGLIKRAERVITCTKDANKIKNMKEAIEVYENWITDYNVNGRSKENFAYLSLDVVKAYKPLADRYEIEDTGFLKAYEREEGDYKRLRSVKVDGEEKTTWDIERNKNLRSLVDDIKNRHVQWFETDCTDLRGLPTLEHTRCIMWGFTHDVAKVKKLVPTMKEKLASSSE